MKQLAMTLGAPVPTPGTWVCGICLCVRPDDQLWCSHLADHAQRERLHQLLGDCDNAGCVPAGPCETCSDAIADERLPWAPAFRCLSCAQLPGELHREDCDDAGLTVKGMAEQLLQLAACERAVPA